MKKNIPPSIVDQEHRDHDLLSLLAAEMDDRAGGREALMVKFPTMLRNCIDDVIMTPKTGRRSYDELEKTEKTYIGTRVEIDLRDMLGLPKGKLDTVLAGYDVDVKNTMGSNWMIPSEAIDHPCILVAADEKRSVCFLGLIVARLEYLSGGANKDGKKSVSADGFRNILWLLTEHNYPPNFWQTVPRQAVERIFEATSGNRRVMQLFREVQERPIGRDVIEAVARQKDFMRRLRADKNNGTRNQLAKEGILLLNGHFDTAQIAALGLPECSGSEFISIEN